MGRELKRVPLDFDWPLNKVWKGFLNNHFVESSTCADCCGKGCTIAYQRLADLVSLLMLSGSDAQREQCHPYLVNAPLYDTAGKFCGKDMIQLTAALAGRQPSDFAGHDACDRWSAIEKILLAAKLPKSWGTCKACKGSGRIWKDKKDYDAYKRWRPKEPPKGAGYQIWETVSEGSPISPVFGTPKELAAHMAGTRWGADEGTCYETWLAFINGPGYAPSAVRTSRGEVKCGPAAGL